MRHLVFATVAAALLAPVLAASAIAGPREDAIAACRAAVISTFGTEDTADNVRLNRVNQRSGNFEVRFRVRNADGFRVMASCAYDSATSQVVSVNGPGVQTAQGD